MAYTHLTKALIACEEALEKYPETQSNWQVTCRTISNVLQGMGQFEESSLWQSIALEEQPDLVIIYSRLGLIYTFQENWQKAIASYRYLLKLEPNNIEAYWRLAKIYARLEQKVEEAESLYQFFQLKPEKATPQIYYQLGKVLLSAGQNKLAIDCYKRLVTENTDSLQVYWELAEIYSEQQEWKQATDCYLHLIERQPNVAWLHHRLGKLWLQQQEYQEAIISFHQAIKIDPNFSPAYQSIVKLLREQEKWQEVIDICREVIALKA